MPSSSVKSSASTAKPQSAAGQPKKKFVCMWPSCGKSFSRSEHLHRHALNHKEGNNTCARCAAHFRRRDLLDRHMIRHKEKDDEAGGEGLGHLATRKRLWRDANGKIVNARRPNRHDGVKKRQMASSVSSPEGTNDRMDSTSTQGSAPPSPPMSLPSTIGPATVDRFDNGIFEDSWPPLDSSPSNGADPFDFLCNASWGSQPFQSFVGGSPDGLPYDDIFKPDTAMSFNAPFTTMGYYSWLFENEVQNSGGGSHLLQSRPNLTPDNFTGSVDPNLLTASDSAHGHERSFMLGNMQMDIEVGNLSAGNIQDSGPFLVDTRSSCQFAPAPDPASNCLRPNVTARQPTNESASSAYSTSQSGRSHDVNSMGFDGSTDQSMYSTLRSPEVTHTSYTSISQISTPPGQRVASMSLHPSPDTYTPRSFVKLPVMTNGARDGLILVISQSRPLKPDGSEIVSSDPLLSQSSLQHYSDLFFTRFNSSYPLIHQATFRSDEVHTYLLMSILLLGATYSDKEAHLLAVCVHDIMRPLIHASKEFGTRPKLWMLQTILLVECFGKSRAGEKQHDMSHLYHGMLINLIRRSDCQTASIAPFESGTQDPQQYWKLAIEAEAKRRLAQLCFMWDTQHAVLFSQSLCMNASELLLTLPWDPAIWEASNASDWFLLMQNSPIPPSYLSILKMYTNPTGTTSSVPNHLNALSRVLILHGLLSLSWDLTRRDQTSLSLSLLTSSNTSWQTRLGACYTRWRADFDAYATTVLSSLQFSTSPTSPATKFQKFVIANAAVCHMAQLILDVDIIDLQINAGAKHIIGRLVTPADRARSSAKIRSWIVADRGRGAARAVWNAGRLFRDGVRKLENWDGGEMFHYPWCLYLATLMCWTFHQAAVTPHFPLSLSSSDPVFRGASSAAAAHKAMTSTVTAVGDADEEDSDWDARAEMNALISGLTRLDPGVRILSTGGSSIVRGEREKGGFTEEIWNVGAKFRTGGLVRCMIKQLNTIRWAVVREGMIVLRGLGES